MPINNIFITNQRNWCFFSSAWELQIEIKNWKIYEMFIFCESEFNAIYVLKIIYGTWLPRLIVTKRIGSVQVFINFSNISGLFY